MNDIFKSDNYDKNLNSLIRVIKLKDTKEIDKQYNKTLRDLSQALEGFTGKAKDVAKFVIYSDLNNYVEPVDKKPLGLFGILKGIWDTILGKDVPIKNDNIRNFVEDKLQSFTMEEAHEYTVILKGINILGPEKLKAINVLLDSKQSEKNPKVEVEDLGYESSSAEYEEISNYQEKRSKALTEDSRDSKLPKEEPIYATIPKEHIEAKRERRQIPKPSIASNATGQEVQKKDKPIVPPKPKNLGQKASAKPKKNQMKVNH